MANTRRMAPDRNVKRKFDDTLTGARIFQRRWRGGGGGNHTVPNFKKVGFSTMAKLLSGPFRRLRTLWAVGLRKGGGGGLRAPQDPPGYAPCTDLPVR